MTSTSASFAFTSSETGSTFAVLARLDHRLHGLQLAEGLLGPGGRKPHVPCAGHRRGRQRRRDAGVPHAGPSRTPTPPTPRSRPGPTRHGHLRPPRASFRLHGDGLHLPVLARLRRLRRLLLAEGYSAWRGRHTFQRPRHRPRRKRRRHARHPHVDGRRPTPAPDTTITAGPAGTIARAGASFAFTRPSATPPSSARSTRHRLHVLHLAEGLLGLAAGQPHLPGPRDRRRREHRRHPGRRTWTFRRPTRRARHHDRSRPSGTYRSGSADFAFATEPGARSSAASTAAPSPLAPRAHFHVPTAGTSSRSAPWTPRATPTRPRQARPGGRTPCSRTATSRPPLAGWTTQGGGYAVAAWKTGIGALSLVGGGMAGPQAGRVTATAAGSLRDERLALADQLGRGRNHLYGPRLGPERDARQDVCLRVRE